MKEATGVREGVFGWGMAGSTTSVIMMRPTAGSDRRAVAKACPIKPLAPVIRIARFEGVDWEVIVAFECL